MDKLRIKYTELLSVMMVREVGPPPTMLHHHSRDHSGTDTTKGQLLFMSAHGPYGCYLVRPSIID